MPDSYFLYSIYIMVYLFNILFVAVLTYILCYLALVTYQLRGVLFAEDDQILSE